MSQENKLKAALRQLAVPLFVGALFGFLNALLIEWAMMNVLINFYGSFYLVTVLLFIFAFIFIGLGLYLWYSGHAIAGTLCVMAGFKLLNWILQWYLPMYWDGYWGTMSWFWEW